MSGFLFAVSSDPITTLYVLQALTYGAAALIARGSGHGSLWLCYFLSCVVHSGLALCHALHA
jgi:hypothetical protein